MFRYFILFIGLMLAVQTKAQQVKIDVTGRKCAADNQCGGDSANFKPIMTGFAAKDVKTWSWTFGEPTSGKNNTSAKQEPRHLYQSSGSYNIVLTATLNSGQILTDNARVSIFPLPPPVQFFGGKSDTTICESERGKLILDPYKDFGSPPASLKLKYSWYPNYGADTNRTIKVDSSGCHSVTVTDTLTGCAVSARIDVKICAEQLPPPKQYWYFGNGAGVEFPQGGSPSAITNGKINTPEGTSVFTNKQGKLQFYTDGVTIFDKNGKPMRIRDRKNPADTVLAGNRNATQAAIIVQQPGCKSCEFIYYVFTTQDINDSTHVLSYSIVDMRLNGGKGEVTALNIPLYSPSTERITAVKNSKDSSYYIVTHDYKSGTIRSFNLTKQGISPAKVTPIGTPQNTPSSGEGQMKIAANGTRLGVLIPGPPNNILELYNYTDTTGAITNKITINLGPAPPKAYGLEFSKDGKKVYVTMQGDSAKGIASLILQYDISTGDSLIIADSRITIDSSMTATYGALQIAEGKIYVAIKGKTSLGVINEPDKSTKKSVEYVEKGLDLKGKTSQLGLPNSVANEEPDSSSPSISASEACDGEPTEFKASPWCEDRNETYSWNLDYKGPDLDKLPAIPGVQFPYASVIATLGGFSRATKQTKTSFKYPKPGTYRVAMYLRNDCKDTLLIGTVTVTAMPTAALGSDIDLCQNSIKLDISDRNPASEYYWLLNNRLIARGSNPNLTATKSGTYVGVAIIGDCIAKDTVKVRLSKPRPLDIYESALNICIGTSTTLNAGFGFVDYKWSNGAITQVVSIAEPGKYKVVAIDSNRCQSTDSITIALKPKATWTSQVNPTKTCGDATGSIKLTDLNPASGTYSFKWFKNGKELNINNSEALGLGIGNYTVSISSPTTCDTTATYAINALTPPINLQATGATPASCDLLNDGVVRIAIFNTAAVPDTYSLTKVGDPTFERKGSYSDILLPFSTTIAGAIKGLAPGTYNLILADKAGCQLAQSGVVVGILPADLVDLGANRVLCQGQETILDAGTKGNTFLWNTGEKTQKITVKTSGDYRVSVSNTSKPACVSASKLTVKINPIPTVSTGTPITTCGNAAAINLSASPSGGQWTGNAVSSAGLFVPTPLLTGQQILIYTVTQNGCEGKGTKTINILPSPPQNLLPPDDFWCEETPKRINAPEIPGATYRWSSGETGQFIQPNTSGKYTLTVSLGTCQSKDTINIVVSQNPKLFNVKTDLSLCVIEGAVATLDPGEAKGWTYSWQPRGEKTRKISVDKVGTYTVTVKNAEGCPTVQPIVVENKCEPRIVVPEIFTPNGDGVNDAMDVFVAHISDFEIKVYNRWGEVVFISDDPSIKWDGRYRELFYPTQSYAWVVTYRSLYFPERPQGIKRGAVVVAK